MSETRKRSGLFGGMKDARASGVGFYFSQGIYPELTVVETTAYKSQDKKKTWFRADFKITAPPIYSQADLDVHAVLKQGGNSESSRRFKLGDAVSWLVNMNQASSDGNIKGLGVALVPEVKDLDGEETEDFFEELSFDNCCKGHKVAALAKAIKTSTGGDFTKLMFSPVDEDAVKRSHAAPVTPERAAPAPEPEPEPAPEPEPTPEDKPKRRWGR